MSSEFPVEGVEITLLLVVEDIARSRAFYTGVLGATRCSANMRAPQLY